VIKNALTYEIMTPESVGVPGNNLVLGKHSGRHALGVHCERLGFHLEKRELDLIYRQFLALADRHKTVEDHQLLELVRTGRSLQPHSEIAMSFAANDTQASRGPESLAGQFPLAYLAKGAVHQDRPAHLREHDMEQHEDDLWGV